VDSVRLRAKQSFTTYSKLSHDTLVLVLSGAEKDRLKAYTWWFPVVGRVPYKGYFDYGDAKRARQDLDRRGFDSYLRPAAAFSTLGWFNDPLLSTTLRLDSVNLVNTVIHELTHNTFYAGGQATFNESFANFVGARGAAWFYAGRGDTSAARRANEDWNDDKRLAAFWTSLYHTLDSAFTAHEGDGAAERAMRLRIRDSIYADARSRLARDIVPMLTTVPRTFAQRVQLDNAALLARRVYLTDLDLFDEVYARERGDLPRTVTRIIELAKSRPKEPYEALRDWVRATPLPGDTTRVAPRDSMTKP
jgi:predicted aminopeptidase